MRSIFFALVLLALSACDKDISSEQHLERAREYIADIAYPSAVIELKNALRLDRDSAEARWLLGKIYFDTGDILAAEKELKRAQELGWNDDDIRPFLARILLAQGKFEDALSLSFQDLSPTAASQLLASQALAELSAGKYDKAEELVEIALEKEPGSLTAKLVSARNLIHKKKLNAALAVIDEVVAEAPRSPEAWRLKGQALLQLQQLEAAREAMNQAIANSNNVLSDIATRALINLQLQDFAGAQADAVKLLKLNPKNPVGNFVQGLLYFQKKQYRNAINTLTLAEPSAEELPLVLYYLSMAHLIEGSTDKGTALASRYVRLAPDNINGRKLLATILIQRDYVERALETIEPAVDYNPLDIGALNIMANALLLDGKVDKGMVLYARIMQLQPDWNIVPLGLGADLINPDIGDESAQEVESTASIKTNFPQTDILQILRHLQAKEFDAAIAAAKSYKWRDLTSLSPYHILGRVYLAADKPKEARDTFNKALKRTPGDSGSNLGLAKIALDAGNQKAARRRYDATLYDNRNDLPTLLGLAALEARQNNLDAMVRRLDQAAHFHPNALVPRLKLASYYLSVNSPKRIEPLFEPLDILQQRSAGALELTALAQLALKQYRRARVTLERLIATHPDTATHHYLLARASSGAGNQRKARDELLLALEMDDNHIPALTSLTLAAEAEGKYEEFGHYLARLAALAPDSAEVLRLQARAQKSNGNPTEALAYGRRAFAQYPSSQTLLELVGYQKAAGKNNAARRSMQAWVQENPADTTVRLVLATDLQHENNTQAAQAQYRGILKANPNNIIALNNTAWNLRKQNPELALEHIRRAAKIAPKRPDVLDTLAVVEYLTGNYKSAGQHIKQARAGDPENISMRYHQAMIDAALGRTDRAITSLEELTAKPDSEFPERAEAAALLGRLRD